MEIKNLEKANELNGLHHYWKERLLALQSLIEHEESNAIDIYVLGISIKSTNEQFKKMISIEIENVKARIVEIEKDIEEL